MACAVAASIGEMAFRFNMWRVAGVVFGAVPLCFVHCGSSLLDFRYFFRNSGFSRLVERGFQEYSLASLNMKKPMSPTPLKCVRRALILALNDSAEALVNLPSK